MSEIGDLIKQIRLAQGITQAELASRVGMAQPTVSLWETGNAEPSSAQLRALENILGPLKRVDDTNDAARNQSAPVGNAFGAWLRRARIERGLSVPQLANASGLSAVAIYNIESGRSLNPQSETRSRLEHALNVSVPEDVREEAEGNQEIAGLGALTDFDPHDQNNLPDVPGVYVFYDISERPIYVGKATSIASRVTDHRDKFWFRSPIVFSASYVAISNAQIRHSVEQVLIKFLKSNAVINKQSVDR